VLVDVQLDSSKILDDLLTGVAATYCNITLQHHTATTYGNHTLQQHTATHCNMLVDIQLDSSEILDDLLTGVAAAILCNTPQQHTATTHGDNPVHLHTATTFCYNILQQHTETCL